jgi:hypothetical protein
MPVAAPWHGLLVGAGAAQLILVVASLAIPKLLDRKSDLARLRPPSVCFALRFDRPT